MIEEYEKKMLKTLQQKMWLVINCPIKCHYVVVHKILILTNIWKIWLKERKVLRAKGLKKKEGRKGGKQKKSWVEKKTKKKGRVELNDEVSQ